VDADQESDASAAVVCTDPLITLSARAPMDIAATFRGRKGLHFIALTQPLDDGHQAKIARDVQAASAELPGTRFVVMAASEFDAYLLASVGVASFPCSTQIFADDVTSKPIDGAAEYDAVIHPHRDQSLIGNLKSILRLDEAANESDEIRAQQINRARVGLCLSSADMHATQYLLCGIPVVATEAAGPGRYLMPPFCRVVPPDPHAIAAAIEKHASARLPKAAVRNHVLNLMRMERQNFLVAANKLANEFGVTSAFTAIDPFAKAWRAQ
jgi:hypothetical protein